MTRVFLTGATGFIGGRLAEVLSAQNVDVVCLVRRWGSASRLSRLRVTMASGDVLDRASLESAMRGCDVVVHCAVDFRAWGRAHMRSSAVGTRNVMRVASELGVARVVHLSSTAVFGLAPERGRVVTEDGPVRTTGHDYCDGKIAGERIALAYHREHGLPVVVLRPTVVYGPFGYYSDAVARAARARRLVLADGATGVCNCLYVDNLVQAIMLAAERTDAVGEVVHVSDAHPVTWREYLERHAAAVDPSLVPLPVMTREELAAAWRRLRLAAMRRLLGSTTNHLLRTLADPVVKQGLLSIPGAAFGVASAKRIVQMLSPRLRARLKQRMNAARSDPPEPGRDVIDAPLLTPNEVQSFNVFEHVTFGIDKARRVLGYSPAIDFDEGMARTATWIRWAGI